MNKTIISASDNRALKLRVLAKKKENVRRKLVVTAQKKESVRSKLAITAKQLAVTAKEKEGIRRKLEVTARNLATLAKEKESVRNKLVVTAGALKLKAENLAVIAREKESIKHKLEVTAETLRLKAKQLAVIAKEKEGIRRKLAITAKQLAVTAKEKESVRSKLLISEVRYRKLFETAKDGVLLIDPVTEKIIDANPFVLNLMGYPLNEIVGKELWEIGAVKDVKYAKMMFEELQTKGYVRYEDLPITSKDGNVHEVEFVSNRYPVGDKTMIQCNVRDITDRKEAEKKASTYLEGLEKLNKMMTGRELKMIELKNEIKELSEKLNSRT